MELTPEIKEKWFPLALFTSSLFAPIIVVRILHNRAKKEQSEYEQLKKDINRFKQILKMDFIAKLKKEGITAEDLSENTQDSIYMLLEDIKENKDRSPGRLKWRNGMNKQICKEIDDHIAIQKMPLLAKLNEYDTQSVSQKTWDKLATQINNCFGKYSYSISDTNVAIISRRGSKDKFYIGIYSPKKQTKDNALTPATIEHPKGKGEQLLPDHYKAGKMDVIAFCHHHDISFCRGNIIKYVTRAGKKKSDNPLKEIEDLKKAKVYLDREIEKLEENHQTTEAQ